MHHRSYQSILPTHNKLLQKRWDDTYFQEHRRRIKTANPMVSTDAPKVHPHVFNKLKKQQRESERLEVVQRDNHTLMLHMENIMHKGSYVDHQNKYDHWSLNYHKRANELQRIQTENIKMLGRIQSRPPNYCVSEWVKDRNEKERLLRMITTHPTQKTHSPRQSAKEKDLQYLPPLAPQTNEKSSSLDIKVSDTDTINSLERDLEIANKNIPQVSKGDIEEMKTFNKPPVVVKSVLEANSILFTHNVQPYSRFSKTVRDFQSFDKDRIPYSVLEKLEPYIDNPELNSDRIKCVSASAVGVMEWIRSIYQYGIITHKLKQLNANAEQRDTTSEMVPSN